MTRRDLLARLTAFLGTATAAVVAIPGMKYILGTLHAAPSEIAKFDRVARLADVRAGKPLQVVLKGRRCDGWTTYSNEILGRVWLVRDKNETGGSPCVRAFTSVCPHMGCQVQLHGGGDHFICPCHRAAFATNGSRIDDPETKERNHAPRGMDGLECRIVTDAATGDEWVEVRYEQFETGLTKKVAQA
ncbi:MAG TPA: Rieske 2Fe-2S domain-containing protein [Caulifigura sp.]|nr:Rieske 2Fe-2S domain-containing protein [Caulifigura sp.]